MVKIAMLLIPAAAGMEWADFKQQFGKVYNGESEDSERKAIFESNKKSWGPHESGAILGATEFSDLTLEEFQALPIRGFNAENKGAGLPSLGMHEGTYSGATIDWTTKGAVTPVKNQGQCGSCWAFSTTGGLEGAWQLASGNLVSMSEQQFVDCDKVDSGCNGGLMDNAFNWAEKQAVATESSYSYTGRDGSCKSSFTTAIPKGGVTGYKDVSNSANALKSALENSPISVAIEADQSVFQQYTGGVISSGCGSNLDHGVLAVGINSDGSIKVKNSWGSSWGANGYVNIATSQCGITTSASYPVVSSASLESVADDYAAEWKEFQEANGARNGDIPQAFKDNVDAVRAHNAKADKTYTMSHTGPFADLTLEEFQQANIRGFKAGSESGLPSLGMHEGTYSGATIDWTTKGAVTPVKNQGQCGSCWAFSTTGGLEGSWQIATGNLVSMSEQQFVDCDKVDSGCNGGLMDNAFNWAEKQAVATEDSYAYTGRDGSCKSSFTTAIPQGGVTGYKDVSNSADALKSAIEGSPVSVAIEADQMAFQMYSGGVITSGCGSNLDHGVLAVGINDDGSIKVKNSWGSSWGVNGYVNIATSQCGITTSASVPAVSGSVSV